MFQVSINLLFGTVLCVSRFHVNGPTRLALCYSPAEQDRREGNVYMCQYGCHLDKNGCYSRISIAVHYYTMIAVF